MADQKNHEIGIHKRALLIFIFLSFSSANAASSFTVDFSLCDTSLGGKGFNCLTIPNDKEVLAYDATTGLWKPKSLSGLSYQGAWDATGALPATTTSGDYYIVSVANAPYAVGDWIVYNGMSFDRINNSTLVASVFGRTGVVAATKGDYVLTKMGDVDLTTTPPIANQILKYNGTNWVPGNGVTVELDPSVQAFAKVGLPACAAGQVLKSNGSSFSCVTDQAGSALFTGTANRVVVTNGSGALSVSTITDTVLGYLTGVTSNIQTQLDSKQNSSSFAGDVRSVVLTGLSTATNAVIAGTNTVLEAFGQLQAQISSNTTSVGTKADKTNITQTITAAAVTGLSLPVAGTDAVNKDYVVSFGQWNKNANGIDYGAGNVGIGTSTPPVAKLEVQGAAVSKLNVIASGAAVDLSLSNTHILRAPGGVLITLTNLVQGGTYTLMVTDLASRTYTFAGCENSYFSPVNGATDLRTTYTILVGDDPNANGIPDCFITWATGFN